MPVVFIPSLLRSYSGGRTRVAVAGTTLRQVFESLEAECPGIRTRIVDEGRIRPEISVSVDNELVDTGLLFPVEETSEVYLLPAISGGGEKEEEARGKRQEGIRKAYAAHGERLRST